MKKFLVLTAMLGLLATLAVPALAQVDRSGKAWGNDQVFGLLATKFWDGLATGVLPKGTPPPSARTPLFIISIVNLAQPLSPRPFEDVIPIPAGNSGTFSAIWHVHPVLPLDETDPRVSVRATPVGTLVWAADLDNNPATQNVPLTSVAKIQTARALGLVFTPGIPFVFVCPVVSPAAIEAAPAAQKHRLKLTTTWARMKARR